MDGLEDSFIDSTNTKDIPVFFIWDRTAALNEGDDKKDALLYPILQEKSERDKEVVTRQLTLLGQVIGLMGKIEQELGKALPSFMAFQSMKYHFIHVGIKYSLGLRREYSYPDQSANFELKLIYFLFSTFYGPFTTSDVHTTESKKYNPDRDKAGDVYEVLKFLSAINRPQLAACLGAWSFKPLNPIKTLDKAEITLSKKLSLMIEAVCSVQPVLGALSIHNGRVIFTKDLTAEFEQALLIILNNGIENSIGYQQEFEVQNVFVLKCYLDDTHVRTLSTTTPSDDHTFYLLIHIRGDLSLTLLVRSSSDPTTFQREWFRTCTTLKDELLQMHMTHDDYDLVPPPMKASNSLIPTTTVKIHKQSHVVYGTTLAASPSFVEATAKDRRQSAAAALTFSDAYGDWFVKSVTTCQQAFEDMPSVSEITLASPTDYGFHATQGLVNNTFRGSANLNNVKPHSSYD